MQQKYKVNIKIENWNKLKLRSIKIDKPLYKILIDDVYPYFLKNNNLNEIPKLQPIKDFKGVYFPNEIKPILKEKAWEFNCNISSFVNHIISFYFDNLEKD